MYHDYRPQSYAATSSGNYINPSSFAYTATPVTGYADGFARRSTQRPASSYYPSTRPASYYAQPPAYTYATPAGYTVKSSTTKRTSFAGTSERRQSKVDVKVETRSSPSKKPRPASYAQPQTHYTYKNVVSEESDDSCGYNYSPSSTPPPPYNTNTSNQSTSYKVRYSIHKEEKPTKQPTPKQPTPPTYKTPLRTTSKTTPQQKESTKEKKQTKTKSAPKPAVKATPADAAQAGIPAGYSYKNWDPTEEPIYLLGSVFDANSLGKWIYDWTVYAHACATPMADLAGDLWLLLIQLAAKVKRADECMPRIRRRRDRDLVDEFLESGERLWTRLSKIMNACEDYMWRAAKKEKGSKGSVTMGANSGCEFVQSMFGRDRKLEETEKLMTSMRLWSMRFDANCEDILRHPSG